MGIKKVLAKFRDNVFEDLENQFEKLDNKMWDASHNSYINERMKEVNSPKYVEKLLQDLENKEISTEEKEKCRRQIIINVGTLKESLKNQNNSLNENNAEYTFNMNYYTEGIATIKYITKKLNEYGLDASSKLIESSIEPIGIKNINEVIIKSQENNVKDKLDKALDNIMQNLGISPNVIEYQFSRKRGPDYTKLWNNTPMTIADEPVDHPKKMRI